MAGKLRGIGESGVTHDFFAYNAGNEVWNGTAFVAWADIDFASYRITATEQGTSGRFVGDEPALAVRYDLRVRAAALVDSFLVWNDDLALASDVATLQATATAMQKLLRADRKIDKTTNALHWDEVLLEEGTVTELVRRELFDADGVALAAETTRIGRAIKPAP